MKVVFIVPRFHTNLFAAVRALQSAGHEVELLCPTEEKAEDHRNLRPTIVPERTLSLRFAFSYMRRSRPDVVVVRYTRRNWRYLSYAATVLGIRTVGYDLRPYWTERSWLERARDFIRGKRVWRITPVLGKPGAGCADRYAYYIPFPVESPAEAETRSYVRDGIVRIICVGKLAQARKQHFLLLEALQRLHDRSFEVTFVGASKTSPPGSTQEYRELLDSAATTGPLAARIRILADVPFHEMTGLYLDHDLFVLPARREALGIAPLEAMACGCVPIVSDECGSAGSIGSRETGFVFDADSVDELTAILRRLLDDRDSIQRFGRNAVAHARQELSPALFVRRFEQMARS